MQTTILAADCNSDSSADDGENDILLETVGVLVKRPCPWVRFALGLVKRDFFSRASLDAIPFCIKVSAGDSSAWDCDCGMIAAKVLGLETFHLVKWWERDDVRCFTRILCGEMLHRIRPNQHFLKFVNLEEVD